MSSIKLILIILLAIVSEQLRAVLLVPPAGGEIHGIRAD